MTTIKDRVARPPCREHGRLRTMVAALVATLAVSGCQNDDVEREPGASDGPLTSLLADGGNSLDVPRRPRPWQATFGSLLLCSDTPVTLTGVQPEYRTGRPQAITFRVRTVPAVADRTGAAIAWAPVAARAARLETLLQQEVRAASVSEVVGTVIDQPCGGGPDDAYTEMLTGMTVGREGAWLESLAISYVADGEDHVLDVHWSYVACGRAIPDQTVCR